MAASLSKIGVLRAQCLQYSWKTSLKHAITDQGAPPLNTANCFHRAARFSRSKHDLRKPKEVKSPVSNTATTASSSFQNARLVRWYLHTIKTRPIATKSVTAALIYTAADITSQVRRKLQCLLDYHTGRSSTYIYTRGYVMIGYS